MFDSIHKQPKPQWPIIVLDLVYIILFTNISIPLTWPHFSQAICWCLRLSSAGSLSPSRRSSNF